VVVYLCVVCMILVVVVVVVVVVNVFEAIRFRLLMKKLFV